MLSAFNISVTYEVAELPPIEAPVEELGGSTQPEVDGAALVRGAARRDPHRDDRGSRACCRSTGSASSSRRSSTNFAGFSVVAVIFVAMIGVGVAEEAGLMAALIRKLVKVAPARLLAFIIVFVGVLSSVATDAGYLILIPLGAAAFLSVGRHPLAGHRGRLRRRRRGLRASTS